MLTGECQGGVANTEPMQVPLSTLRDAIQAYHLKHFPNFILFSTDFQKTFPSTNVQYLFRILQLLNSPHPVLQLLNNLYKSGQLDRKSTGDFLHTPRFEPEVCLVPVYRKYSTYGLLKEVKTPQWVTVSQC